MFFVPLPASPVPTAQTDALMVEVASQDGCPTQDWFRGQLEQRGLRGHVRASLGAEGVGYAGDIEAQAPDGAIVRRHLTGAECTTVAEGLLVVAQVHLAGPLTVAPSSVPPPPNAPSPLAPAPAKIERNAPPPAPRVRLALGAFATVDTVVSGDPAFGGGLTAWLSLGSRPMRGLALSFAYSRAEIERTLLVTHEHLRARLDLVPLDLELGTKTSLGFSLFLSVGSLQVSAQIEPSTPGARPLWLTGLGARLRRGVGPLFFELSADATLAITRRSFVVNGTPDPLFSLPLFGVDAALAVGVPLDF